MNIPLQEDKHIKILNSESIFKIMQRILLREEAIDQDREHAWVAGLDTSYRLLFIELIGLGSVSSVVIEPMDVFSFALQKRAKSIILIHNHPNGDLTPSHEDKTITDKMIQAGQIVNVSVMDNLIISTQHYISFKEIGLLDELEQSNRFLPSYKLKEKLSKQADQIKKDANKRVKEVIEEKWDMIEAMRNDGVSIEQLAKYTRTSEVVILQELEKRYKSKKNK